MSERDEKIFECRNFLFNYKYVDQFVRSEWDRNKKASIFYIIWRCLIMLYFFAWLIVDIVRSFQEDENDWYMIYVTHWTFIIFNIHLFVSALLLILPLERIFNLHDPLATEFVCTMFWALVYDSKNGPPSVYTLHVHAINGIVMLIDLFITAMPMRLLHFWIAQSYAAIYILFTLIYYGADGRNKKGGRYVYKVLDYGNNTGPAVGYVLGFVIIGVPVYHALLYGLFRLRIFISDRCFRGQNVVAPVENIQLQP